MPVAKVIYTLKCGHNSSAPETLVSGLLYCPWHKDVSPITGVIIWEWRAKCCSCRYSRWAGMSEVTANIFLIGHLRRNHGHNTYTELTINPAAQRTADKMKEWKSNAVRSS